MLKRVFALALLALTLPLARGADIPLMVFGFASPTTYTFVNRRTGEVSTMTRDVIINSMVTTSQAEIDHLQMQGVRSYTHTLGYLSDRPTNLADIPLYRYRSTTGFDHIVTTSRKELGSGWVYEGALGYLYRSGEQALSRMYRSNVNDHSVYVEDQTSIFYGFGPSYTFGAPRFGYAYEGRLGFLKHTGSSVHWHDLLEFQHVLFHNGMQVHSQWPTYWWGNG